MKFFHTADVHLGAEPDRGFPWSRDRSRELWESFRNVIRQAGAEHADLFLIAGDLFHRQPLVRELKEVNALFASIPDTRIVLMAGNHDPMKQNSAYRNFPWAKNVSWFREPMSETLEFPELGVSVTGLSYDRKEIREPLYDRIRAGGRQPCKILLAHGGDDRHIPFSKERLLGAGFDYIALGHIHKPQELVRDKMLYPGALEPIDKNDTGVHGYIRGEYRDGLLTARFRPAAGREYKRLRVPVTADTTQFLLEQTIRQKIREQGEQHFYCLTLEGRKDPGTEFLLEPLYGLGNIREILDQTSPAYEIPQLQKKYQGTLLELFISSFPEEGRTQEEEKALDYGISALLEAGEESL